MKLVHALIENFKGLRRVEIDFTGPDDQPRPLTALLGDNGSGKTSVLQAIALTLSLATRRILTPRGFRWHGFLPERVGSMGQTRVELLVRFESTELKTTRLLFKERIATREPVQHSNSSPGKHKEVRIVYEKGRVISPQEMAGIRQFRGRFYLEALTTTQPELNKHKSDLGDVFWFDQDRNLGSIEPTSTRLIRQRNESGQTWTAGVEQLREALVGWWGYHKSERKIEKDYIEVLERQFAQVFPGTEFSGIEPRKGRPKRGSRDFYFYLQRGERRFDLAELSSGEQAVFALSYDFVRRDIWNSIVLIDELELHLHPPEQQALLGALRRIGPDCQFIITTHSEHLADVIPREEEVRLPRGRPCL